MGKEKQFRVLTVGDVNLDHVIDMSDFAQINQLDCNGCYFRPIRVSIGGNGTFFAEAAIEAGFKTSHLICSVGTDLDGHIDVGGRVVIQHLKAKRIKPLTLHQYNQKTGEVIIIYQPHDQRVIIADRGANKLLTVDQVLSVKHILDTIDLLYISGYSLLNDEQRISVHRLMNICKDAGIFIVVDVVPHDLYKSINFETLSKWTKLADGICTELSTITGFLSTTNLAAESDVIKAVTLLLRDHYNFGVIRLNARSDFLILNSDGATEIFIPYSEKIASLRFTDRVIAHTIIGYLRADKSIKSASEWADQAKQRLLPTIL